MKSYKITVNGTVYDVAVEEVGAAAADSAPESPQPVPQPQVPTAKPQAASSSATSSNIQGTKVSAPLPGTVVKISVAVGDVVKKGQVLVVLEAMKMENDIVSPADGTVVSLPISKGSSINAGNLLAVIR